MDSHILYRKLLLCPCAAVALLSFLVDVWCARFRTEEAGEEPAEFGSPNDSLARNLSSRIFIEDNGTVVY